MPFASTLGLALLLAGAPAPAAETPVATPAPAIDEARLDELVAGELAAMHAATAAELVPGAPPRAVRAIGSFALEHTDGRVIIVLLGLAPGAPGDLPVATEIEYLRYSVGVAEDGSLHVGERPARADVVTGVREALRDEARAMDAATAALVAAHVALPPGSTSWKSALRSATYDARLPRERFAGEPRWSFVFDPWDEAHGGYHGVLLDRDLHVVMIDGRAP